MKSIISKILILIFGIALVAVIINNFKVDNVVDTRILPETAATTHTDTCVSKGDLQHTGTDGVFDRYGQWHSLLSDNNTTLFCVEHDKDTAAGNPITGVEKNQEEMSSAEINAAKAIYYGRTDYANYGDTQYSIVACEVVASYYYSGKPALNKINWYDGGKAQQLYDKIQSYKLPDDIGIILWDTGIETRQKLIQIITVTPPAKSKIRIQKSFDRFYSGDASLSGAEYCVYENSSCTDRVAGPLTTNRFGETDSTDALPTGTYYVKETSAPTGCSLDPQVYTVNITSSSEALITVSSTDEVKTADLKITKKIGATKTTSEQNLAGVQFTATLISDTTQTFTSTTTTSNGIARFYDLPYGRYTISETTYPNTVIPMADFIVNVDGTNNVIDYGDIVNTPKTMTIQVNKTFKESDPGNASLAGAVYTVYDSAENAVLTLTTNEYGVTPRSEKLPCGVYYVQETKPSQGCKLDPTRYTVTADASTQTIATVNKPVNSQEETNKMRIKVNKKFGAGNTGDATLTGAVYTVYYNGAEVTTITTGTDGTGISGELPVKNYTVKETSASAGCTLDPTTYTVNGVASEVAVVEYPVNSTETVITTSINIKKNITASGNTPKRSLAGAQFTATLKSNPAQKYVSTTTDSNGNASFSGIPYGTYTISETTVPVQALKVADFDVSVQNGTTLSYELDDEIKEIEIQVEKVLNTSTVSDAKVVNATYGVYSSSDCSDASRLDIITIGTNGIGKSTKRFACLPNTKYYVKEIQASEGCFKDTTTYEVTCNPASQNIKVTTKSIRSTETVKKNNIEIVKKLEGTYNTAEAPLAGARFTATLKSNPSQKYLSTITDANGYAVFTDVLYGDYTIEETTVPSQALKISNFDVAVREDKTERAAYHYDKLDESKRIVIDLTKRFDTAEPNDAKLVNAKYGVYTAPECTESTKVDEIITNAQGKGRSHELLSQNYYVREIQKSEGCLIDKTVHNVVVDPSAQTSKTIDVGVTSTQVVKRNNIEITKKLEATGSTLEQKLAGARFTATLKSNPAKKYLSTVTDENGYAVFTDVLYGDYIIEETTVPVVSLKIENFDVNVTEDKTERGPYTYTLVDKAKKIIVKLNKEDKETGHVEQGDAHLNGAEYTIYRDEGCTDQVESIYISEHKAQSSALLAGIYYLKETKAPEGYLIDETVYKIEMTAEMIAAEQEFTDVNVTSKEQVKKGSIHIVKGTEATDGGTTIDPAEGVELTLTLDSNPTTRYVAIIDANGQAEFTGIPYGWYTLAETKGIPGFSFMDEIHFYIQDDGQKEYRIVREEAFKAEIEVVKKDSETGKVIPTAGITYKIWDVANQKYIQQKINYPVEVTLEEFSTNDEGKFVLPYPLIYGEYELEEIRAPYGYVVAKERIPFEVKSSETEDVQRITIEQGNVAQKARITVVKKGEVFTGVTNEDSEYGTLNKPEYTVTGLSGVEYTITALEDIVTKDGTVRMTAGETKTFTTNESGVGTYEYLYLGKYKIKETKTINGYIINSDEKEFELTYQGQNIEILDSSFNYINERQKVEISFKKILEGSKFNSLEDPYKDVKFGLYAREDIKNYLGETKIPANSLIEVVNVQVDGIAKVKTDLPIGKYYIKELATNDSYEMNINEFDFEFASADNTTRLYEISADNNEGILNKLKGGDFELEKVLDRKEKSNPVFRFIETIIKDVINFFTGPDKATKNMNSEVVVSSDVSLVGAKYQLFYKKDGENIPVTKINEDGTEDIAIYTTNDEGKIVIDGLPYGEYSYKEIEAPKGFVLDETFFDFELSESSGTVDHKRENTPQYGELEIDKTDIVTGDPIPNCSFRIKEVTTGRTVVEGITDDDGICKFKKLPVGKYTYEEFDAPEKYRINPEVHEFEIKADGEIIKADVTNELKSGSVEISKIDVSSGEVIPNCKFVIKDEAGNVIREGITDENGICKFEELPLGKYIYQEVEAPADYIIDPTEHEFAIENDGQALRFTATNQMITGDVIIKKTDLSSGAVIPNCKFVIRDARTDEVIREGITNENGICEFRELPYGKYTYQEVEAPKEYILDNTKHEFSITEMGQVLEFNVTNELKPSTGDINVVIYVTVAIIAILVILFIISRMRGNKDSKGNNLNSK